MSTTNDTPSAEIVGSALVKAAKAAEAHHLKRLDEQRAEFIERMTRTQHGGFFKKRFYTREEAEGMWPKDHHHTAAVMWAEVYTKPLEDSWQGWRVARARALQRLGSTRLIHNIRLPESDIAILRPFLNGESDA